MAKTRTRPNPIVFGDELALTLGDDPDRLERAQTDPTSADWLLWSAFAPTDRDRDRLVRVPRVLTTILGTEVTAPMRVSLFTGGDREPLARPGRDYVRHLRQTTEGHGGGDEAVEAFRAPVEVPLRIEGPGVLALVDAFVRTPISAVSGRDRILELTEVGLEQSRAVGKRLLIGVVYPAGTHAAAETSARIGKLRAPGALAAAMPWRSHVDDVAFREVTWREVLATWESEASYMGVGRREAKRVLDAAADIGLR